MLKGRYALCRAASMARMNGYDRSLLVRRAGGEECGVPRAKTMKTLMLIGCMSSLAATCPSSCAPRPEGLEETLEPTFTDGARKYWHLRFQCPCDTKTSVVREYVAASRDGDDAEEAKRAGLDRFWEKFLTTHGEHLGLGGLGGDDAMDEDAMDEDEVSGGAVFCQPCCSPGAKRGRLHAEHPTPQSIRDAHAAERGVETPRPEPEPAPAAADVEDAADDAEPPLPPPPTALRRTTRLHQPRVELYDPPMPRDRTDYAARLRRQYDSTPRRPLVAGETAVTEVTAGTEATTDDESIGSSREGGSDGCEGCRKKDALLGRLQEENQALRAQLSIPGAAWAKTLEALPNRTRGMATAGLELMSRLEAGRKENESDGADDGSDDDDKSDDDSGDRRPRRRVRAIPLTKSSTALTADAKTRDVKPVLSALFVHGGGNQARTAAILQAVIERAGTILGLDLKEIKALRAMGRAIKGFFKLAELPRGGRRPTYSQQKVDAVMEAVTPAEDPLVPRDRIRDIRRFRLAGEAAARNGHRGRWRRRARARERPSKGQEKGSQGRVQARQALRSGPLQRKLDEVRRPGRARLICLMIPPGSRVARVFAADASASKPTAPESTWLHASIGRLPRLLWS